MHLALISTYLNSRIHCWKKLNAPASGRYGDVGAGGDGPKQQNVSGVKQVCWDSAEDIIH